MRRSRIDQELGAILGRQDYTLEPEELLGPVSMAPPGVLYGLMVGDTVKVTATVRYRGPALDETFYAAIGNRVVAFDEIWHGSSSVHFNASTDFVTYTMTANIPITQVGLLPWTPGLFDIYVKIGAGLIPRLMGPEYSNVIEVVLKSEFQNFVITDYSKV